MRSVQCSTARRAARAEASEAAASVTTDGPRHGHHPPNGRRSIGHHPHNGRGGRFGNGGGGGDDYDKWYFEDPDGEASNFFIRGGAAGVWWILLCVALSAWCFLIGKAPHLGAMWGVIALGVGKELVRLGRPGPGSADEQPCDVDDSGALSCGELLLGFCHLKNYVKMPTLRAFSHIPNIALK